MSSSENIFPECLDSRYQGPAVALLQLCLKVTGFASTTEQKLKVDGIYGPATVAAVKAFQTEFRLKIDGRFSPECKIAFFEEFDEDLGELKPELFVGETVCD